MRSQLAPLLMHDPVREPRPLRTLGLLLAGALGLAVMLLGPVARGDAARLPWVARPLAPADTDSVATELPTRPLAPADTDSVATELPTRPLGADSLRALVDSLGADSVRALLDSLGADSLYALVDSLAPDTAYRVQRYLDRRWRDERTASLFPRRPRPFGAKMSPVWKHELTLDSTGRYYVAREAVGEQSVRYPVRFDRDQYTRRRQDISLERNWRQIAQQRAQQRSQQQRGGLGLNITIPGGRQSAFTTIFGKNEVDLRVNGQADIRAGFDYRKSEQQVNLGSGAQVDPDFKQDLRLGVTGTIGDKMRVDVNWDTNRDFDYQNQLKLQYTGYEDEIIQRIEAGNVFLQTPSTLIRGGQSLFGIKSELKIGGARLTTVVSQQEGQSNNLSIEGGAESTRFDLKPTDYEDRTHYFLSYYFRNRWENALSAPPNVLVDGQFERITDIEVWKLQPVAPEEQNVRQVVAMVDLGESQQIIAEANAFTRAELPSDNIDQYFPEEITAFLRPGTQAPKDYLESTQMDQSLTASDYQVGQFKKLERGRDYDIDEVLGYISLRQRLQDTEALAVSFRYIASGQNVQVGDFASQTGGGDNSQNGDRLVLKLLKPINLKQPASLGTAAAFNPAAWYLEMRNIYRLGRGLRSTEFELEIAYEPPGKSESKTLPGITGQRTLIQVLGLDRINENGADRPDNIFDYLPNYSILPGEGLLLFPYLEPFGTRIDNLIVDAISDETQRQENRAQFVFSDLYQLKKENARRNTQLDVYSIQGSYKGSVQSFYTLPGAAFAGLVEGSVRVSSGGTTLQEGADYIVDYQGGTVTITNPSYLSAGRDIEIDYEQNALINLQKKTLLGARLDYTQSDRLVLGATVMRMSQKSLTDKFRIGEEPIANTVWGLDGNLNLEPRWLTRAIDALPLIQTKEPSEIIITGEFAQLLPGHTQTNAFDRAQRDLDKSGRNFKPDELEGVSFLDDFESFENTFSLNRPGAWLLSASPVDSSSLDELSISSDRRAVMGWYQLNPNSLNEIEASGSRNKASQDPAVSLVLPQQVFPNRQTTSQERFLTTLDVFFTPHQRGPYNYNTDLGLFLDEPEHAWGGMTQRLSEGYTDFTLRNIEFVEFIFQPFPEGGDAAPDARLFVDLGQISEDVIPDAKLNTEDGLSLSEPGNTFSSLARLSTSQQDQVINPITGERITEDLGLDGLASFPDNAFANTQADENVRFIDFLAGLDNTSSALFPDQLAREIAKAQRDPSGDDYHYFLDDYFKDGALYPNGLPSIQERFSRFFPGQELNSFEAQTKLARSSSPRGNSRVPDSEDLNLNSTLDTENSYFQYELPLRRDRLDVLARPENVDDYVVEEIRDGNGTGTGWYLVRIPVKNFDRRVGDIQDFTLVESIRLWTSGHTAPITLRFATLELVGSQWRKSEIVTNEVVPGGTPLPPPTDTPVPTLEDARLSIESVNNEENALYAIPQGTIVSEVRTATGERRKGREQSMALRVENLRPGRQQAIFQTYSQGIDLLKYKHLRMFLHLHGRADGRELQEADRDQVRVFVRLGANETNDFYEYEQPLTPSPLAQAPEGDATSVAKSDYLWRTNQTVDGESGLDLNAMNIVLGRLNTLKFERDENAFPSDSLFWSDNGISNLADVVGGPDGFAPPGTRIGVKGTPSLGKVNTIVVGLRNPAAEGGTVLDDVTIWVNELRVSGYDEDSGIAALFNADMKLADLGRIKATFTSQTDGFGALSSTLGEREQINVQDWTVNTQLNIDKFIPERYGWSIPVTLEMKSRTSTPRYDPNRGDVRVDDLLTAIDANENLSDAERQERRDAIVEQAQTHTVTRSVSSRLQKSGSRSRLLRNTLDGISVSYSFAESDGRTPNLELQNSWRWSTTLGYRLNVRRPRFFRPFGFLDGVPVLDAISGLRFNYLPNSLTLSAGASRRYSESKERPDPLRDTLPDALDEGDLTPDETDLINAAIFPLRPQHTFSHDRKFGLQYNPFGFLNLSFDTDTNQSLNDLGVILDSTTVLIDADGNPVRDDRALSLVLGEDSTLVPGVTAFGLENVRVRPFGSVLNDVLGGQTPRTERYESRLSATFRPRIDKIGVLDWISIQDLGYSSSFSWRNGSVGNNFGATAGTSVDLRGGLTLRPMDLFEKFGFYRTLLEQQRQAEQNKQERRQQRETERRQAREERQRRREQERLEEEARRQAKADAEAEGRTLPEEDEEAEPAPQQPQPPPEQDPPTPETQPPAGEGEDPQEGEEDAKEGGGGFRLPLPNPVGLLRQAVLGLTGIEDLRLTYNGNRRTESTNIGTEDENGDVNVNYSLLDAFRGRGPSLGFRLGLADAIGLDQRIINDRIQAQDALTTSDRFQANTRIRLSQNLNVNLTWSVEWGTQQNITYRTIDSTSTTETGTGRASVWAFQASYLDLFTRQLTAFNRAATDNVDEEGVIVTDDVLTNQAITRDFIGAYLNGLGSLDAAGRLPFPMPGWVVNYSGISNWPVVRWLTQSATLRHGYSADYGSDYRTNLTADPTAVIPLRDGPTIRYNVPGEEVGSVRINERFQPLVALDLTLKGNIQTSIAWNTGNSYTLSTTNNSVSETKTSELTFSASYQKQGLRLPFFSRRLNNRIGFSITVSRATNDDRTFLIRTALEEAATRTEEEPVFQAGEALEGDFVRILTQHTRLTVAPKITYQLSNRVSADAFVRYENFIGDSRRPSTTTINGGFNFRVSIAN